MRRLLSIAFLIQFAFLGCENQPFEVVSPGTFIDEGSALLSVRIPSFSRGLIQRVTVEVTEADTGRIRAIKRDLNFPLPGGTLAVGEVTEIPSGKRRFRVKAFDTGGVLRFEGSADSTVVNGRLKIVDVSLKRIGGRVSFEAQIDLGATTADSASLSDLPERALLDILELVADPHHPSLKMLPLASVGLGDAFSIRDGILSRRVTIDQIPSGNRQFIAYIRDLTSNRTFALADKILELDVLANQSVQGVFEMAPVTRTQTLNVIFDSATLPRDSTVIIVTPQF
jgi:hypothetical protein